MEFDADNPPMTDADLARLRPAASVVPALVAASLRRNGRRHRSTALEAEQSSDVIEIVTESLQVGKREVGRVRSYVAETAVNEQVSLRTENVNVERQPVDRTVNAVSQDRIVEVEEVAEGAVVSKQARVVEEISLHKDAVDRTEVIADTLRHTEIGEGHGAVVAGSATRSGIAEGGNAGTVMPHMDVIASDGTKVGTVDHMHGAGTIKLANNTSPDNVHHYIPMVWVAHVDQRVYLKKSAAEITADWLALPE